MTHRLVRAPSGEVEAAGIMTSSWTVPAARGRGCLTNFVEWSREVVRARGSDLLLAFMTDTNASRRRLAAAGADLVPTWYALWNAPGSGDERKFPSPSGDHLARLAERTLTPVSDVYMITYPDADEWAGQLLRRPDPVDVVTVPGGCAVMERAVGTDRLLAAIADRAAEPLDPAAVLATLVASAARRGCKLFGFMIDPAWAEVAGTLGAAVQTGRLTLLSDRARVTAAWRISSGDRM